MYIHFAYFKSCLIIFVSCLCTNIYFFVLNIDDFLSAGAMLLSSLCLWLFTIQHIYVVGFAVTVYIANISLTEVNNNKYSPHPMEAIPSFKSRPRHCCCEWPKIGDWVRR